MLPHESLFLSTPNDVKIGTPIAPRKRSVGPQFLSAVFHFGFRILFHLKFPFKLSHILCDPGHSAFNEHRVPELDLISDWFSRLVHMTAFLNMGLDPIDGGPLLPIFPGHMKSPLVQNGRLKHLGVWSWMGLAGRAIRVN